MINHITIQGNLTRDPDVRVTPAGMTILKGGLAHNQRFRNSNGETREKVTFVDFTIWGKQAETFAQFFFKGDQVLIEGRLELETWQARDGSNRSKHGINVEKFHFVGQKGGDQ